MGENKKQNNTAEKAPIKIVPILESYNTFSYKKQEYGNNKDGPCSTIKKPKPDGKNKQ